MMATRRKRAAVIRASLSPLCFLGNLPGVARARCGPDPGGQGITAVIGWGYERTMGSVVVWLMYRRQHRHLMESVRAWLPGEQVKDVAVGHKWSSTWPTFAGIGVLLLGGVLGPDDQLWISLFTLVLGFGLLIAGWLATPATLIVTTPAEVILIEGRRRTYEPIAVEQRMLRSSWVQRDQIKDRRLWIPLIWKKHLPPA